ncbi:uncharacterized protein K460DRAFT_410821 [Cucurbitaria berberidis CBS 394.84]|uniref:Uncharacterized protein n=1 Tax=Cucurbitaria berberidis CBS 394.84 TaxID=1168544 RepID=A0A9P4G7N7_9PLEO|nr:uncharacterized protein K460DRAFT_410821 [Cucurbitaria berberidis CBS 394.84]KAF1840220.1 hypothetical protein K460DRAFT_410821 [Cucurbitaria berberidis CBS 394.84]
MVLRPSFCVAVLYRLFCCNTAFTICRELSELYNLFCSLSQSGLQGNARRPRGHSQLQDEVLDSEYEPEESITPSGLSDQGSDELSPDDEIQSTTHRKRTMKPNSKPAWAKKKIRQPNENIVPRITAPIADPSQRLLTNVRRLESSKDTKLLNKWLHALPHLSEIETVIPTTDARVETIHLTPLGQADDMPGRQFAYSIELVDIEVTWDPSEGEDRAISSLSAKQQRDALSKYRKIIKTWKVYVWNTAHAPDKQKHLRIFPEIKPMKTKAFMGWQSNMRKYASNPDRNPREPADGDKWFRTGGPLDINICPTIMEASKVATEAFRLLNKYPLEIAESEFVEYQDLFVNVRFSTRALIELQALLVLDHFDFRIILYPFRFPTQRNGYYCLHPTPNNGLSAKRISGRQPLNYQVAFPAFASNPIENGLWPILQITDNVFTQEDISALPEVSKWWGFKYGEPTNKKLTKEEKRISKAPTP